MTNLLHLATIPGIDAPSADVLRKAEAYRTFCTPTFMIPLKGVVIITGMHTVASFDAGLLHNATGPALSWPDGTNVWAWHGTRVPSWVIESHGTELLQRIASVSNTEHRRCAIERFGWDRYLTAIEVRPVDETDDPGNPGHRLRLFDVPDSSQLFGAPVRLYVMDNASLDRDGSRRVYAETVPVSICSAVEASAWAFDVPVEAYRMMARAT